MLEVGYFQSMTNETLNHDEEKRPVKIEDLVLTTAAQRMYDKDYFKYYKQNADQGHAWAQLTVGYYFEIGKGVEINLNKAFKWYKRAADQGDPAAQNMLGVCFQKGLGIKKNLAEGVEWFKLAADQGLPDAQFNFGVCYEKGMGVEKNLVEAAKWLKLAADRGHLKALEAYKALEHHVFL